MKIGIFLPHRYGGGTLRSLKNLARMIYSGSRASGNPADVVVSVVPGYDIDREFSELFEMNISVRETRWESISADEVKTALFSMGKQLDLNSKRYWLPVDMVCNFHDCDFWLIVTDRTEFPVAPVKPYAMMIWDYIQRYVPEIFEGQPLDVDTNFIASARGAAFVMVNMKATGEDVVQYAGVGRHKLVMVPTVFDPLVQHVGGNDRSRPYLIWVTNSTQHKNHLRALDALDYYYGKLGGQFDTVVTGGLTHLFMPKPPKNKTEFYDHHYPTSVRLRIKTSESLKQRVSFLGELSDGAYCTTLAHAAFLFHPVIYDNGTFSVLEAACFGTPTLSSRYPQMEQINDEFSLRMMFCNPYKPEDMALRLKDMESACFTMRDSLPDISMLKSHSVERLAEQFWRTIEFPVKKAIHE